MRIWSVDCSIQKVSPDEVTLGLIGRSGGASQLHGHAALASPGGHGGRRVAPGLPKSRTFSPKNLEAGACGGGEGGGGGREGRGADTGGERGQVRAEAERRARTLYNVPSCCPETRADTANNDADRRDDRQTARNRRPTGFPAVPKKPLDELRLKKYQ